MNDFGDLGPIERHPFNPDKVRDAVADDIEPTTQTGAKGFAPYREQERTLPAWAKLFQRPEWTEQAACRGTPTFLFYPTRGEMPGIVKAVCGECPVQQECADAGMREQFGTWGGLSENERRRKRRKRRAA